MAARRRPASKIRGSKIYQLYVELEDIEPRIWRRLLVPAMISLPKLHDFLQIAMGWTNSHLHSFQFGEKLFSGPPTELEELNMVDEKKYTLEEALADEGVDRFIYDYDFGDSWRHLIAVESTTQPNTDWPYPLCIGGARAAPPEDVGGVGGYEEFLSAIKDPEHDDHDSMLIWVGGAFDPEGFDLNTINRTVRFGQSN